MKLTVRRILAATQAEGILFDFSTHDVVRALHRNTERIDNPFLGTIFMSGEFFQRIRQDNRELVLTGAGGRLGIGWSIGVSR